MLNCILYHFYYLSFHFRLEWWIIFVSDIFNSFHILLFTFYFKDFIITFIENHIWKTKNPKCNVGKICTNLLNTTPALFHHNQQNENFICHRYVASLRIINKNIRKETRTDVLSAYISQTLLKNYLNIL